MHNCHIVIDIGGTKSIVGLLGIKKVGVSRQSQVKSRDVSEVIWSKKMDTRPGLSIFPQFLSDLISDAREYADTHNYDVSQTVCLGLPGNFDVGDTFNFKSGSGRQVILNHESFDSINIRDWLMSCLDDHVSLWAVNDAVAQAVGSIVMSWQPEYVNQTFLYLGPGTGLGGAIVRVGKSMNEMNILTDGHIYDILIQLDDGTNVMAEDVLSGRGLFELTDKTSKELNSNSELWNSNKRVIYYAVDIAIRLVKQILNGDISKKDSSNQWTTDDINHAKSISSIILGGSIGTKGRLGQLLVQSITSSIPNVNVFQSKDPDVAALIGIYHCKNFKFKKFNAI